MRIGIFNGALPQEGRKNGGVDYFVHRLANHLVQGRHEVVMFTHSRTAPEDTLYEVRPAVKRVDVSGKLARMTLGSASLNFLDTTGLDVLHLNGDDWFYWRRQVPTVRTFYGSALREARSATSVKRRLSQGVIFPLEIFASRLATASYRCGPGMPRGYRIAGALPLAADLPEGPDVLHAHRAGRPTVLFVGTWEGRKRGRELRDAFERDVVSGYPDAQLLMVSDYCEESDHVAWLRFPSDQELAAAYRRAWVFCLPSAYEGFGLPYIEAMAHATPVVATPNPGSLLVSDQGRYARITPMNQVGASIAELLGDAGERRRLALLGQSGPELSAGEAARDQHVAAFQRAIDAFAGRPRPG